MSLPVNDRNSTPPTFTTVTKPTISPRKSPKKSPRKARRSPTKSRSDPYIKKVPEQSYQSSNKPKPSQYPRPKSLDRRGEQQQQIKDAYNNNNNNVNKKAFSVSYNHDGFDSYRKNNAPPAVTVTKSKSESVINYRKPSREPSREPPRKPYRKIVNKFIFG